MPSSVLPPERPNAPRANVLGVGVSAINMPDAVRRCENFLHEHRKGYICVTGVHGIMEAQRDAGFCTILNRALLCTPDGMPTVWVGRLQGHREMRRVYGPDFMLELCRSSVQRGCRHFLYGGKPGVVGKLEQRLQALVPGIAIVGTYTPPFRPHTPAEEDGLVSILAEARPDIIWVGLSTPKQERFMAGIIDRLQACLMIGVGAAFDIHAGLLADAPSWMKISGLQWLYRLMKEPRRLGRRYLTNNPQFLWEIAMQFTSIKKFDHG